MKGETWDGTVLVEAQLDELFNCAASVEKSGFTTKGRHRFVWVQQAPAAVQILIGEVRHHRQAEAERTREASAHSGVQLIAQERIEQLVEKGWTPEHDRSFTKGELAWAAVCYAAPTEVFVCRDETTRVVFEDPFPFDPTWDARRRAKSSVGDPVPRPLRGHLRVRELVKAGALIAAELDRYRASREYDHYRVGPWIDNVRRLRGGREVACVREDSAGQIVCYLDLDGEDDVIYQTADCGPLTEQQARDEGDAWLRARGADLEDDVSKFILPKGSDTGSAPPVDNRLRRAVGLDDRLRSFHAARESARDNVHFYTGDLTACKIALAAVGGVGTCQPEYVTCPACLDALPTVHGTSDSKESYCGVRLDGKEQFSPEGALVTCRRCLAVLRFVAAQEAMELDARTSRPVVGLDLTQRLARALGVPDSPASFDDLLESVDTLRTGFDQTLLTVREMRAAWTTAPVADVIAAGGPASVHILTLRAERDVLNRRAGEDSVKISNLARELETMRSEKALSQPRQCVRCKELWIAQATDSHLRCPTCQAEPASPPPQTAPQIVETKGLYPPDPAQTVLVAPAESPGMEIWSLNAEQTEWAYLVRTGTETYSSTPHPIGCGPTTREEAEALAVAWLREKGAVQTPTGTWTMMAKPASAPATVSTWGVRLGIMRRYNVAESKGPGGPYTWAAEVVGVTSMQDGTAKKYKAWGWWQRREYGGQWVDSLREAQDAIDAWLAQQPGVVFPDPDPK